MDERTPGRGVSITSSGDTVWTFTLEGKGLPSEGEFYVRMPVKSVYVPKIKDGVCIYHAVNGTTSLADHLLRPNSDSTHVDAITALLESGTAVGASSKPLTWDVQQRFLSFVKTAGHCIWRRSVIESLFSASELQSFQKLIGAADEETLAPGLGRFIVESDDVVGLLLPCGSGFSSASMVFRLSEELLSFKIAGRKVDQSLLNSSARMLKLLAPEIACELSVDLIKANLVAHMHRAKNDHVLSQNEGSALVQWADLFLRELTSIYLKEVNNVTCD